MNFETILVISVTLLVCVMVLVLPTEGAKGKWPTESELIILERLAKIEAIGNCK